MAKEALINAMNARQQISLASLAAVSDLNIYLPHQPACLTFPHSKGQWQLVFSEYSGEILKKGRSLTLGQSSDDGAVCATHAVHTGQ
jgi:hypothetical protein